MKLSLPEWKFTKEDQRKYILKFWSRNSDDIDIMRHYYGVFSVYAPHLYLEEALYRGLVEIQEDESLTVTERGREVTKEIIKRLKEYGGWDSYKVNIEELEKVVS